jgi:phage/plasmid-like protein (TIGR03299 family)
MPAELSITDGIAAFADSRITADGRVDAWHRLGTPVGHEMTAQEALEAGHLANWNVRKVGLWADICPEDNEFDDATRRVAAVPVSNRYGVVFDNPVNGRVQTMPATVGERYEHAQNEALAQFGEAFVDEIGARNWQTVGSLRGYTQVFMTMLLPQTMELTGHDGVVDTTNYYLALLNSHDGSTALTGLVTPVRIVCANTQAAAIGSAVSSFKIRHTANWRDQLEEARRVMGIAFTYEAQFEAECQRLYQTSMSVDEAKAVAEDLVELSAAQREGRSRTMRQNTANGILKLFVESPTIKDSFGGTRYGFFNAVTEFVDHYQGVRGAGGDEAGARAVRTITQAQSSKVGLKNAAWRTLTSDFKASELLAVN